MNERKTMRYEGEPDYEKADEAFNEALRLAGAEAHGPTMVITHFIVDAAMSGLSRIGDEQPTGVGTGIPTEAP